MERVTRRKLILPPVSRAWARDARGTRWLDALVADCRFAAAHFGRKPITTITIVVVLAVGMSISTLLFSYVHSYAVQAPSGVARHDDLVRIRGSQTAGAGGRGSRGFTENELAAYRKLNGQFAAVAWWTDVPVVLDAGDEGRRGLGARATLVSENYFSVLGVQPLMGGLPLREDAALTTVVVIGHSTWDQLFAKSPDAIGSTLTVNGVTITVVGVAPPRFGGVRMGSGGFQLWMPLAAQPLVMREPSENYRAVARLRPGVTPRAASAAVQVVAERTAASDPELRALDASTEVVPLLSANGDPMFERDVRLMSVSVALLALLVLLITCTNVSALLTGLAAARRQEIAIRLSLGAARSRIIRQLLTESVWLASIAAAAALGIVWATLRAATRLITEMPFDVGITWPSTAFTFGVALAVGILFGLSPALHATRLGLASVLRDSGGAIAAKRARLQRGLVVAQIAFTQPLIVLLTAVLLLIVRELQPRRQNELADRLITLSTSIILPAGSSAAYQTDAFQQLRNTMHRLHDRLQATPGVEAVAFTWGTGSGLGSFVVHPDDRTASTPQEEIALTGQSAAHGYFALMGVPIVRGRDFAPTEVRPEAGTGDVAIIVGTNLARRLWGAADPIGRRLQASGDSVVALRTLVVAGVLDEPAPRGKDANLPERVYLPPDTSRDGPSLLLLTAGVAQPLIQTVRKVVELETPGVVASIRTIAEMEDESVRRFRIVTGAVSAAAITALLLSAIGLYAVIAFSVGERTGEIAVRMAVGARGQQIVRKFVADGLRLSAFGLLFGLPISLFGLRVLMTIPDVPAVALQPVTAIAALGVLVVATAAVWIPARRAALVDPAVTLRRE